MLWKNLYYLFNLNVSQVKYFFSYHIFFTVILLFIFIYESNWYFFQNVLSLWIDCANSNIIYFFTDSKNSSGVVGHIDELAHNAIAVYWNPLESNAKVSNIYFNVDFWQKNF